jgi:hypothetical protein
MCTTWPSFDPDTQIGEFCYIERYLYSYLRILYTCILGQNNFFDKNPYVE